MVRPSIPLLHPEEAALESSNKTLSKTVKSLKKKKTYYVRIRTYKKVGSAKYYSKWSTKKSVKISR